MNLQKKGYNLSLNLKHLTNLQYFDLKLAKKP